jgi:hypothetical protein
MRSRSSTAYATRLPDEQAALVEDAFEETDRSPTELFQRAVEYYVRKNPNWIQAFYPDESIEQFCAEFV